MSAENTKNSVEMFNKNKFIVVRNFLQPQLAQIVYQYTLMKVRSGQVWMEEPQVPGTPSIYADTLTETILLMTTPHVEKLIGKQLYPTYSSLRVYKNGDKLRPHIDRPSSEFGLTVCLGFDISNLEDQTYRWKIYMDNKKDYRRHQSQAEKEADPTEGVGVSLNPGDCAIYYGCEVRHWRDAFEGVSQSQAFLMFVDQNGPYAKYRYDTRPHLGFTADTITDPGPHSYFPDEES